MAKIRIALAVATVALSPTSSSALSLFPQRGPQARGIVGGGGGTPSRSSDGVAAGRGSLFGKRSSRSSRITQQWMLPIASFRSSKFLSRLNAIKEKEDEPFFAGAEDDDDDDTTDEKSWPVKPTPPLEPPVTPEPPVPPVPKVPDEPTAVEKFSSEFITPLLDPTIAKNVPSVKIQGAAINGAFLTLLTSYFLFGPFSISSLNTLVVAASVGIITAYVSITEGSAGDFLRSVGGATMKVTDIVVEQVGELKVEKEVGKIANALLTPPKETTPPKKNARPDAADEIKASKVSMKQPSVDYDAAAKLAYTASGSPGDFNAFKAKYLADASAMVASKYQDQIMADEEEEKAKAVAAAEKIRQEEEAAAARAKAEEAARAQEEAQLRAMEEARAEEEARAQEEARLRVEEEARAEEEARLRAEEEARAEEESRLRAEEEARAQEEARLRAEEEESRLRKEEEARLAESLAAEEQRRLEEQAEAAREAVRLMEEQDALMDDEEEDMDEDEVDDEDWEASVRLANELQGIPQNIPGDIMDDVGDDMLQYEIDNLSQDEEDALGKAAREAVRKYEEEMAMKQGKKNAVRSSWDDEMVPPPSSSAKAEEEEDLSINGIVDAPAPVAADYSKMTVVQLKDMLRSKGLKLSGRKAELIERLESSS